VGRNAGRKKEKMKMKKYIVDIAPGYGHPFTASLSDGKHGCTVQADTMDAAIEEVRARAKRENWPKGEAMITEINALGQRVEGKFGTGAKRIGIN
jgi:hypothetical protein